MAALSEESLNHLAKFNDILISLKGKTKFAFSIIDEAFGLGYNLPNISELAIKLKSKEPLTRLSEKSNNS